jgi:hypothetical protein
MPRTRTVLVLSAVAVLVGCAAGVEDATEAGGDESALTAQCTTRGWLVGRRAGGCAEVQGERGVFLGKRVTGGLAAGQEVAVCAYRWQSLTAAPAEPAVLERLSDEVFVQNSCLDTGVTTLLLPSIIDRGEGHPHCDVCNPRVLDDEVVISVPPDTDVIEDVVLEGAIGSITVHYGADLGGARAAVAKLPAGLDGSRFGSARVFVRARD